MKKTYLLWSLVVAMLMAVCSCSSNSKSNNLLSLIPADAECVAVVNPRVIVESAGGTLTDTELAVPDWITDLELVDQDDVEEANDNLKRMGISTESVAVAGSITKNYYIVIVKLTDKDKFTTFVKDELDDETKDSGLTIYTSDNNEGQCVAVSGSYAYMLFGDTDINVKRTVKTFIEDAKNASFDKSPVAKYITEGNAYGYSVKITKSLVDEYSGFDLPSSAKKTIGSYYCGKCSLSDDKISTETKILDKDGNVLDMKDFEQYMDYKSKVSKDALAYMGKNESLVAALSLKDVDWKEYIDVAANLANMSRSDRQSLYAIADYLENIDGTVAIGLGLANGLESGACLARGEDVMQQFYATIVIETKDGKAAELMSELEELLSAFGTYEGSASKGLTINLEDSKLYVAAKGDLLIASNHRIEKNNANPAVKAFDFTSYIGAIVFAVDKNNKLIKDLGLSNDILVSYAIDAENSCVKFEVEVKGGKGKGILEKIGNMCLEISKSEAPSTNPIINYRKDHDWSSVEDADAVKQSKWLKK